MSTAKGHNLRSRTILIIEATTSPSRRFKELEIKTQVPAGTWRSFWNREDVLPSGTMLEQMAVHWPQYAFWMLTGVTDAEAGHVAPPTAVYLPEVERMPFATANAYFASRIRLELSRPQPLRRGSREYSVLMGQKAVELLGGYPGYTETRRELEYRGYVEPSPFQVDQDGIPYAGNKGEPDPIMERAIQVAELELLPLYASQQSDAESKWEKQVSAEVQALAHMRRADLQARLQQELKETE